MNWFAGLVCSRPCSHICADQVHKSGIQNNRTNNHLFAYLHTYVSLDKPLHLLHCTKPQVYDIPCIPHLQANTGPLQFLQETHSPLFTTHTFNMSYFSTQEMGHSHLVTDDNSPISCTQECHHCYIWRDTVLPRACCFLCTRTLATPNMATQSKLCFEVYREHRVFTMASPSWGLGNKR